MDGWGIKDLHKCGEEMSKNSSLPSQEQQETSELNGSGGGRGKGIRGPRPFVPFGDTNRDKNSLAPLSPSLSPRPSHSAHLFLLFLARKRGVLAHFFTTFVKIFDSPIHPSVLKVWSLFFSSSLACIAHFIL